MRIAQLTQAFNPLLLALLLLQHIILTPIGAVHQLGPLHHRSRLNVMDQPDDIGDDGNAERGGCDMMNRNNPKQTATNIAQKAAQEAEQAYGTQQCAADEVAHQVKKQLADKANTAAKAAEAALSCKQQMVEQLETELCVSETALQQETALVATSQNNLNFACQSAKQAHQMLLALQSIIKIAHENLANAKNAAAGAQQQLAEKAQLIESAQHRIDTLKKMLQHARNDLENIKKSAYKAVCAAAEARQKANRERRNSGRSSNRRKRHKIH
ncbi:uncharacterized protein LOC133836756 [Drosophila sulfurigaster albostrigata]|uniref:uncharacterized protein LOC133836756 n=1 Tax=Drosophila sulfurigaster albostrigata TaxID=89887 RepID=UPI002D21D716|nr:uncharacterized protein LOC133836756 [Drosophila sulfurigaster albostrigata]